MPDVSNLGMHSPIGSYQIFFRFIQQKTEYIAFPFPTAPFQVASFQAFRNFPEQKASNCWSDVGLFTNDSVRIRSGFFFDKRAGAMEEISSRPQFHNMLSVFL